MTAGGNASGEFGPLSVGVVTSVNQSPKSVYPNWFYMPEHPLEFVHGSSNTLVYQSASRAELKIAPSPMGEDELVHVLTKKLWIVEYTMTLPVKGGETRVQRLFTTDELHAAFAPKAIRIDSNDPIHAKRYGVEVFVPGKFVRQKNYLNIPGLGTGVAGDANLSICLDPEVTDIQDRVCHFSGYRFT